MTWRILQGDVLARLAELPDNHVQCVVTSPPYWGLRDYKTEGQLGLEPTPEEYVEKMVEVFREVRRILRVDGTLWCNMGDGYASGGTQITGYNEPDWIQTGGACEGGPRTLVGRSGLKAKDLIGMPWRLAFALQADGWWLRSDIIWSKSNPMPESVTDRPTKAHEYVFLLTKSARYYYDQEAVREASRGEWSNDGFAQAADSKNASRGEKMRTYGFGTYHDLMPQTGRNLRTVWTIPTEAFPEAHFATFPRRLVLPCIQAGTSAKGCCAHCWAPSERVVEVERRPTRPGLQQKGAPDRNDGGIPFRPETRISTTGWRPTCRCPQLYDPLPCKVLDPFCGSGTVGVVATQLGREFIGIELNADYVAMAERRIRHPEPEPMAEVPAAQLGLW